jgi:WD40 repeat protein/tRNA A-37 threonylcarbamoyl transferase component Bud32
MTKAASDESGAKHSMPDRVPDLTPPAADNLPAPIIDQPKTAIPPRNEATRPFLSMPSPDADAASFGRQLAHVCAYELLGEIARGAMGIVYKARDRKLNRIVALKMTRAGQLASGNEMRRFQAEAEAAAQLDHPHIVPVYEVGEADGLQYISMAFVEGQSLATRVEAGPLAPREAAALIRPVAEAVAFAHAHGVIHRDLKPGNILLDAAGQPRVTDFGLAKRTDTDSMLTQAGQVVGTPSYMPPEQAEGKNDQVGPLADVYSLGATLYRLVTGRPPFQAANVVETLKQVVEREPAAPRSLNDAVDRDLNTIVLKCLEKRPERRYASATELAEDLRRYLDRRPIQARPAGAVEKAVRWCRRNPIVAASLAGIAAVGMAAFVAISWSYVRAEQARQRESTQRELADQARRDAERKQQAERWERYRSNLVAATSALELNNVGAAGAALDVAPKEYRQWEWDHLYHRLDAADAVLSAGTDFSRVLFSAHGERVATLDAKFRPRLWDIATRKELDTLRDAGMPWLLRISPDARVVLYNRGDVVLGTAAVARDRQTFRLARATTAVDGFSPDGKLWATGIENKDIQIWDTETGQLLRQLHGHEDRPYGLAFSGDGRYLASAGDHDRTVRVWEVETGKTVHILEHTDRAYGVVFSPDGKRLLTVEFFPANTVRLWDVSSGKLLGTMRGHSNEVRAYTFSPDGKRIATGAWDQTICLWDGHAGNHLATLKGHRGWINSVDFNADGTRLISASQDQTVRLWDVATGELLSVLHGHKGDVVDARFSADARTIISGSADGSIRLWDAQRAERRGVLRGHSQFVYGVAFHPDGVRVASASWDGTIRLWHATTSRQLAVLAYPKPTTVTSVALHPDGKLLASLGRDDFVRLWDIDSGSEVHRFPLKSDHWRDSRVTFGPRGDLLAAGSYDRLIHIWHVPSRTEMATLSGHKDLIRDLVFSPDGTWLASAGEKDDSCVRIWDLASRQQVQVLEGHRDCVYALAVSRDGKQLASGSLDGTVRLWDTATWQEIAVLNHGTNVYSVAYAPDNTRLACACANNTIRLWDTAKCHSVAELYGHGLYVHQVAFSPDGTRLVSGSGDFTVRIWDRLSVQERAACK